MKKKSTTPKKAKKRFAKKELDAFKEKLINLKDDLVKQMHGQSHDTFMQSQKDMSGDMSGYSLHLADMASDNYERDFNLGLVTSERKIVLLIDEALKRIEDGSYGVCQSSGKPIAITRLKAIPYARYTKNVQEQLEKENKM